MPFDKVKPVSEITSGINMMLYSDNGVGKTPLIGTGERTLILDADKGSESAAAFGSKADKWLVESWDDMESAKDELRQAIARKRCPYKWVWLDSVSTAQEIGLEDIMEDVVAARPHRKVYHPDKGEYGENMNRLKLFTRHMAALPINFGMTAHPFEVEDTEGNLQWMPFIQGKNMIHVICSYMNVIGYLTVDERTGGKQHRILYTRKHNNFYARDRFGALGGRVIDPTIPKIQEAIERSIRTHRPTSKRPVVKKAAGKRTIRRRSA